ncbi:MAG: heme exporter protein CcmB [Gammaproteobacteria bacterium]|nr:heme exporter protein CcmB [Gammaproteobacteria bacterium]
MNNQSSLSLWFMLVFKRDLFLSFKKKSSFLIPFIFFLIVISLFPLALGSENTLLSSISSGIIWVAALLASLLAIESIFNEDYRDGTLDQFMLSGEPLFILVFAKVFAHWLISGAPLLFASVISTFFLFLPEALFYPLLISLLLGTFLLSLLGALGAALAIGKTAILSSIIVIPLSIPVLIFGISIINAVLNGQQFISFIYFLCAMLAAGIPGLCLATVEAIKINYD